MLNACYIHVHVPRSNGLQRCCTCLSYDVLHWNPACHLPITIQNITKKFLVLPGNYDVKQFNCVSCAVARYYVYCLLYTTRTYIADIYMAVHLIHSLKTTYINTYTLIHVYSQSNGCITVTVLYRQSTFFLRVTNIFLGHQQ